MQTKPFKNLSSRAPGGWGRAFNLLSLLVVGGMSLCGVPAHAQHGHLNAGAVSQDAGVPLLWVNGAIFATNSGFIQTMAYSDTGTYAGYYNSGPTLTALPTSVDNGGPIASAASQGSFIQVQMILLSAPVGGTFAFWEEGATSPTYSLGIGETSLMWALSDETLGAGSPGGDPYGHIHGRKFTATMPGDYIVGFQLFDTSDLGPGATPIHTPSEMLYMQFSTVVPEPGTTVLLGLGILGLVCTLRTTRRSKANS